MYASTGQDQTALLNQAAANSNWSASDLPGLSDAPPEIPEEIDTPFFRDALENPQSRPYVLNILDDPDPVKAFDEQSEQDLSEALHPTGKFIVFKALVMPIAERMERASEAISAAAPVQDTDLGRLSAKIVAVAPNPESTLKDFYTHIALDAFDPAAYEQVTSEHPDLAGIDGASPYFGRDSHFAHTLGDLGLSKKWKKRLRRIEKVAEKVGVAVAAVAVTVATAGTALAPILAAATTVAGVGGAALKEFGHTKRQKRIGGYLSTGAAVEGAAAATVGAATAVSNLVSGGGAPAGGGGGGGSVNQAAPSEQSGIVTSLPDYNPNAPTDGSIDQSVPGGAQPSPDDGSAIGTGSDSSSGSGPSAAQIASAIGQTATAAGKVIGADIQADQPASGQGTAAQQAAQQAAATASAAQYAQMIPAVLLGGGVLLLLVLGSGSSSGKSRRNPGRRVHRRRYTRRFSRMAIA
jgi:hypothetical protein